MSSFAARLLDLALELGKTSPPTIMIRGGTRLTPDNGRIFDALLIKVVDTIAEM